MDYTKSLCFDKLDLIKGMIEGTILAPAEIEEIYEKLNDVSHDIDEYIDRNGIRDRKNQQDAEDYLNKCRTMKTGRYIGKFMR